MKFMLYNHVNEVANELFDSLHSRNQGNLETSIRVGDFIFDSVQMLYYKFHKVNYKPDGSYIDSLDWIRKKAINPKNKDDKCFQYVVMAALIYEELKWNPERVSNIKPIVN